MHRRNFLRLLVAAVVLLFLPESAESRTGVYSGEDIQAPAVDFSASWKEIERLAGDGKLEEASKKVEVLLGEARAAADEENWTRALVRSVQLRVSLHKIEEGIRFLKEQPWPQGELHHTVLDLVFAQSLAAYAKSWEVRQRERVVSVETFDLERWTWEQLRDAALAAYREVWSHREALGGIPVSRLHLYLLPSEYPEPIRGTVRDAVSYLFVELLADSSFWSPRDSNEVYRLDLGALIGGQDAAASAEVLASTEAHPLVKLAAVLSDLEAWHRAAGRREAALEARRERLRRLHSAFVAGQDRRRIREALAVSLASARDLPWWSMGMATLAGFLKSTEEPASRVLSHEAAVAGFAAWPESPGGIRCRDIAKGIEAPNFFIEAMASDGLRRRSIRVIHKNLSGLYFRAYPFDPRKMAERQGSFDPNLDRRELERLFASGPPVAAWRTELPETPDFSLHDTWVVPPIERPGAFLVLASPREDFAVGDETRIEAVRLILGDLALVVRNYSSRKGLEVLALSGATGQPVAGAEVRLFRWSSRGVLRQQVRISGPDGAVRFPAPWGPVGEQLLGSKGREMALVESPGSENPAVDGKARSTLLYTDRAVYRPGQKILWKVLAYAGRPRDGRFHSADGEVVSIGLYDPQDQKIAEQTATTNEFGTASGEFPIPPGRLLGSWRLESRLKGSKVDVGAAVIQVEEYKRPTFEVALEDPSGPLRLNRSAKLAGKVLYYFGLPVAAGEVHWRVTREPVFLGGGALGGCKAPSPNSSLRALLLCRRTAGSRSPSPRRRRAAGRGSDVLVSDLRRGDRRRRRDEDGGALLPIGAVLHRS